MQKRLLMLLLGGAFVLLGVFTMPMRRANPRQNLVDNPFGWGLFGFGLSSLLVGISTSAKERARAEETEKVINEHVDKGQPVSTGYAEENDQQQEHALH